MVLLGNSLPEHRKVEPSEAGIKIKTEFISGILISYDLMIPFRIHGSTKNAITVQIFIDQITYRHVWTIRCRMRFKILLSAVDTGGCVSAERVDRLTLCPDCKSVGIERALATQIFNGVHDVGQVQTDGVLKAILRGGDTVIVDSQLPSLVGHISRVLIRCIHSHSGGYRQYQQDIAGVVPEVLCNYFDPVIQKTHIQPEVHHGSCLP